MKKIIYSLLLFFLASGFFCTSYAQYGWDAQFPGTTENFYSDYFTDVFSDWAVGSKGTILQTIDGESNRVIKNSTSECLPLPFIANQGQIDNNVKFYADIFGGTVFITKNGEIVYSFRNIEKEEYFINPHSSNTIKPGGIALKEEMIGARLNTISGEMQTQTKVNYYKGSDQSKWKGKIPTYERIDFGEIYDGINLKIKAYSNNVEKLFIVEAGADPDLIQVNLSGINALGLTDKGELEVKTELGTLKFTKPLAYQEADGEKYFADAAYWIKNNTYGFTISNYDKSKELIIDPLIASTFLGGFNMDGLYYSYVNVDDNGFVYATGVTGSPNFPVTSGVYDEDFNGVDDVFISKFSSDMTTLLASTYFGGILEEYANSLIFDKNGNIFIAGSTGSKDLPVTGQAYDTTFSDNPNGLGYNRDVFIAKFDSDLENLLSSTYLGGYDQDGGWHTMLNTDTSGNIYVGGSTYSSDFPTTPGAFCNTINDFSNDVFVTIFDNLLNNILASTLIGSGGWDVCRAIELDSLGNIYICGGAGGNDFPTTPGAFQEDFVWYGDAFVSIFNNNLTSLTASTYIGGSHNDDINDLVIDKYGDIYVAGKTRSADFPVTPGAYDESFNGSSDIFISKFNKALTKLDVSTYLGGYDYEAFWGETGITIDEEENVYIASGTCSDNFPVTPQAYDISFNGDQDVIVSKFDKDLGHLIASTFLGGPSDDYAVHVVLHGNNILINGHTWSYKFPTTPGAYDTIYNSSGDVFISIFDSDLSAVVTDITENNDRILPNAVFLYPNFPNPFHLETNIIFDLSESCLVELAIYDLSGKMVKSLVKGFKEAGHYSLTWDGTDSQGKLVVPGIYIYKIKAGNFIDSKRCIVLRN